MLLATVVVGWFSCSTFEETHTYLMDTFILCREYWSYLGRNNQKIYRRPEEGVNMSMLTYNIKHNADLSSELDKAEKVAKFGVEHNCNSSKQVSHFGLKSILSNAVLRKYVRCKTLKKVSNVVQLTIKHFVTMVRRYTFRH